MKVLNLLHFLLMVWSHATVARAWLSSHGLRDLVREIHRTPNKTSHHVSDPLSLTTDIDESERLLLMEIMRRGGPSREAGSLVDTGRSSLRNRQAQAPGQPTGSAEEEKEAQGNASGNETEIEASKFADDNFVPGIHLDFRGQPKYVTPAPIQDVLIEFMGLIEERQNTLWQIGVFVCIDWVLQALFIILAAWVLGLFVPMYVVTQKMGATLPMEADDRVDKMLELAEMYNQNPLRFAHLPGFGIEGFDSSSSSSWSSTPPRRRRGRGGGPRGRRGGGGRGRSRSRSRGRRGRSKKGRGRGRRRS